MLKNAQHRAVLTSSTGGDGTLPKGFPKGLVFLCSLLILLTFLLLPDSSAFAAEESDYPVKITAKMPFVDLPGCDGGKNFRLEREQDIDNQVDFDFSYTSRKCPPYCVQPMTLSPGVETIGELEMIHYLKKMAQEDGSLLVIDSRTDFWLAKGMIPCAISIPWTDLHYRKADKEKLMDILEFQFGVVKEEDLLNFENAKTLVFYCNGYWCGQSPTNIRSLLMLGYPAHKLKWYRGGMQAWSSLGFDTIPHPDMQKEE
ncbi:MAG: rhodanese-like domain-containing protein [Magnetococcales bacterium]|nr:rhodanese-like domain-containing protein [Magnetococcales bacterium]